MKLTDKQSLQQKQSLAQKQSSQRLWLSFIITLFIFVSSVSAYFLVKNSQDIRRSAAEPYSQCTCLYVSDCSVAGMKPCAGTCSPACSGPTSCCQPITNDLCTKGERYCVDNNSLAVCKADRSGYTITACAAGKSCDPTTTTCIAQVTPTLPCSTNGGQCMSVNCASVYMQSIAGTCTNPAHNCCKTIQQFACDAGAQECVNSTTRRYCNSERTAWITAVCPGGSTCQNGTCIFSPTPTSSPNCAATGQSCQSKACCNTSNVCETVYGGKFCISKGTECSSGQQKCAQEGSASYVYKCSSGGYWQRNKACDFGCNGTNCKSACTPGAKRCSSDAKALETCNSSGTAWSKQSCASNSSCNSQTLTCINTNPTCQGTCYTNLSCTAIGKAPATGTCINETSVCCKEADAATAGLKALGEKCTDSSECVTANCSKSYINNVGQVVLLADRTCVYSLAQQDESVIQQHQDELIYGVAGATLATGGLFGATAIPSIISLAGGSLTALPTAAYVYGTTLATTPATTPAWVQTTLSVASVASGWAAVGGGTYACATNPNSPACDAFIAGTMADPNAIMSLANATDDLIGSFGNLMARNNLQRIGGGAYGDTYIDLKTGKLKKIYKYPSDPNNILQMDLYEQFSDQAPWITHRGSLPDGSGFAQDFFSDTVPIKNFQETLTLDEFNQAIADLRTMQNVTGVPHGDLAFSDTLHGGNSLIKTLPDGSHRVVIVDYGGLQAYYNKLTGYSLERHMQSELKFFQQHLASYLSPADKLNVHFSVGSTATTQNPLWLISSTLRDLLQSSSSYTQGSP